LPKLQVIAQTRPKVFATKAEAIERHLRVAGLKGLVDPDSAGAEVGIKELRGEFMLATDPLVYALGKPDFIRIAQAAGAPINLLCGEVDNVASPASMRRLGADVTILPGLGHNPM